MGTEINPRNTIVCGALASILSTLSDSPDPLSGRAIKASLAGRHPRAALEAALKMGLDEGSLSAVAGSKGARLYRVSVPCAPGASQDDDSVTPDGSNLLTRRQLAELLAVNMQTVTKWGRDGLPIAHVGRKGKPSLYDEAAVRAWLAAREYAAQT